jgi:hypothetical protein
MFSTRQKNIGKKNLKNDKEKIDLGGQNFQVL